MKEGGGVSLTQVECRAIQQRAGSEVLWTAGTRCLSLLRVSGGQGRLPGGGLDTWITFPRVRTPQHRGGSGFICLYKDKDTKVL